ncbi:hypothetical protein L596_019033 [Steinernema carpocapsae]|uniref:Uncharacterized protein n=1 Tax=Steinernema carpocapsae TaxID=34508 RepID=A0A4U5N7G1_STECR|nr:hypothetical protein L596_019033 [Steinernema carpocapsae]
MAHSSFFAFEHRSGLRISAAMSESSLCEPQETDVAEDRYFPSFHQPAYIFEENEDPTLNSALEEQTGKGALGLAERLSEYAWDSAIVMEQKVEPERQKSEYVLTADEMREQLSSKTDIAIENSNVDLDALYTYNREKLFDILQGYNEYSRLNAQD